MALITFSELLDLIIMTVAVGFIFMDFFPPPSKKAYDPLQKMSSFNWHALWFAVMITAPSVIFHELALGINTDFNVFTFPLLSGIRLVKRKSALI